ncbi:hypothetical protein ARMGADRAFT_1040594 [Armillaria gallica]|uniref:Uncharacterized protein n=1 Tax=Armillaria gallica TaxID=47427 RepID=A0A2H3CMU7_ARMGA|nr:hypothetical protein ARMGADRAFT_1040594 [Armillaria gallica]
MKEEDGPIRLLKLKVLQAEYAVKKYKSHRRIPWQALMDVMIMNRCFQVLRINCGKVERVAKFAPFEGPRSEGFKQWMNSECSFHSLNHAKLVAIPATLVVGLCRMLMAPDFAVDLVI